MFQFQTGAIKSMLQEKEKDKLKRFNSKLVRLKVSDGALTASGSGSFQFQTGAIKSGCDGDKHTGAGFTFQFQTGAIKSAK